MSDTAKPSGGQSQRVINAIVGAIVLLVILMLANYVFNRVNHRFDLTENNIYTLTDGTKSVLDRLEGSSSPVTMRFYAVTEADYVSQKYLTRASAVEDFLNEYQNAANGLVTVKRFNPEPYSDDAENAKFDGLPQGVFDDPDNPVYFGLVVECEGRKEVLPFLPARQQELLEYDVTRALLRVSSEDREKVTIMTSMEIGGGFGGNFGAPPKQPWYLVQSLQRDYEVEIVGTNIPEVPSDTDVLVVLHPYDMTDEGQFAVDQYLLKGGRVLATVDPMFFAARYMAQAGGNPMMPQPPSGPEPSSDINKLLNAWGVNYDPQLVLADMASQTRIANGYSPTVLSIPGGAMNREDPATAQLSDLFLITPGGFELLEKDGIESTVLVTSSNQSQMVTTLDADPTQRESVQRMRQNFKPDGERRVLAARLSGNFQTAFPQGLGGAEDAAAVQDAAEPVVPADEPEEEMEADAGAAAPAAVDFNAVDANGAAVDQPDLPAPEPNAGTDEPPVADKDPKAKPAAAPAMKPEAPKKSAAPADKPKANKPSTAEMPKEKSEPTSKPGPKADDAKPAAKPEKKAKSEAKPEPAPAEKKPAPAVEAPKAEPKPEAEPKAEAKPAPAPETGGPEDDEADITVSAEGADDAEDAGEEKPVAADGALKTSEKEGIVVVIADSDFVYDSFAVQQVQNLEGRIEMQPVNSNLALFENILEQLAGGDDLIRVRSRASNHRPFTRLNDILEDVEAEFRPELDAIATEINGIETERQLIGQNILRTMSQNPDQMNEEEVSKELGDQVLKLQEQEQKMDEQMRELQRKQYEVNKKIKAEFDSSKNSIILLVTAVLPLLLAIFGIGLAIVQRFRTAAQ